MPTGDLRRRPATETDYPFVHRAQRAAYEAMVLRVLGVWDTESIDRSFAAKWAEGGFEIVEIDGEPVGAIWIQDGVDHVRLREIFLLPAHQRRGLGTALIRSEIRRAHEKGVPLRLRVIAANDAVRLDDRLGFRVTATEDAKLWMQIDP